MASWWADLWADLMVSYWADSSAVQTDELLVARLVSYWADLLADQMDGQLVVQMASY
jgi:hypothetical protein